MVRYLLLFFISLLPVLNAFTQCVPCNATTYNIDLSGAVDTVYVKQTVRNGNCCTGTNCVRFNILVNPGTQTISLTIANPAPPGNAAYYQIDCGPQTSLGTPVCISGKSSVCISYCKPGNDNAIYTITASSGVHASGDLYLRQGCTGTMSVTALQPASVIWNSIYPGAPGAYNSYLSCTTGCLTTNVTSTASVPAYIDYEVSGNGLCGGPAKDTVRVYVSPPLAVNINPANPAICPGGSGSVTLTANVAGGNPPYKYTWSTGQTTQSISVSTITTYTVSVADATMNCPPVTASVTVTPATVPPAPTVNSNAPVCEGSTLQLNATGVAGATYNWTGPAGFTSTLQNPTITNVSSVNAGVYTVTVTAGGCTSAPASTTVVVNPTPAAPSPGSNSPICTGNTLTLLATSVTGATYNWTGPAGFTSSVQNPTIANVTSLNAGTYSVTATVNGCTGPAGNVTVVLYPTPQTPTITSNSPVCVGAFIILTSNAGAGSTFIWTGPNGFTSSAQNPVISNATTQNAGTYSLVVKVNGCNSAPATTNVVVNSIPPSPSPSSNSPLCIGNTLNLFASTVNGATYSWTGPNGFSSNLQNPTISNVTANEAGVYRVTAWVLGCGSAAASTTVVINPIPAPPAASSNSPLCTGNTLNLSTPTVTGATYNWTGPNGFTSTAQNPVRNNVTVNDAGVYSVTITVNGCSSAAGTVSVVINPTPAAPAASSNSPVCTGNSISLNTATVLGATYNWTGPAGFTSNLQNPVINNAIVANAGVYSVRLTVTGCQGPAGTTTVVVNPTPASPIATSNAPICTGNTLNLSATAIAGATYDWTGPGGFTSAIRTPVLSNVTAANAGTYNVTATVNGCTSTAGSVNVVINPTPATPAATSNSPVCSGNTITLQTPAIAGATYTWTGPGGFTSSLQNPVINNAAAANAGVYSVVITVTGCPSAGGTTSVVVNPTPPAPTPSSNSPLCVGNTLNLTASTVAGATFSWTGPGGYTSNLQNPVLNNVTLLQAGVYKIRSTVLGCVSAPDSVTVVINPIPATPAASSNSPLCTGNTLNLSTPAVTGATYNWTGPNSFTSTAQNPVRNNVTVNDAGVYSVTITVNGCTSAAGTVSVVINPTPAAPSASSNSPVCTGNTISLNTSTVSGATYNWTGPAGFTSNLQNPVVNNAIAANAGVYSVRLTVIGCQGPAGTTTVVVNPTPATPIATSNAPVCTGSTLNLSATASAGATYNWTGPGGFISVVRTPAITNVTAANSGTYNVTATVNGCTSAAGSVNVVINPTPATPAATSNSPVCTGNTITLQTPAVAGATYTWTGPSGFTSSLQNPVINNAAAANAGVYSVVITVTGCPSAASITNVIVNPTPSAPTPGSNSPICAGNTINLTASTVTGATYNWNGPNGFTSTIQNPVIVNATSSNAGYYHLSATVNGCVSLPDSVNVIVNGIPSALIATSNSPVCTGNSINLTTQFVPGGQYNWTGPNNFTSTLQNPIVSNVTTAAAGNYSVVVSVNGCTGSSASTNVVVNPTPAVPTAGSNSPVCTGNSINLTTAAIAGGTYSWTGPGGFTSGTQTPSISNATAAEAGVYSLTITVNGCTSNAGITTVVVNPTPSTPTASSNSPVCAGNTLNLSTPTVTGARYNWTGPNGFTSTVQNPARNNVTVNDAGAYSVSITVNGCTSAAGTVSVVINPTPAAPAASSNSPVCTGNTISLNTSTVSGGAYSWTGPGGFTSNVQNPVINNAVAANSGVYSVRLTVTGCQGPAGTTTVVVNSTPATPIATSNAPICTGNTLNLSASAIAGATYSWAGPGGFTSTVRTPAITNVTAANAGTYNVTATVNVCTSTAGSINVIINPTPATPAVTSNSPVCTGNTIALQTPSVTGGTYTWTGPNSFTSSLQNPVINNATSANAGVYSVVVTVTGCPSAAGTTNVAVNPTPPAPTPSSNSPVCVGSTLNLYAAGPSGAAYSWTGPAGFNSNLQNPVITNASSTNAGVYSVSTTVLNCSSAAASISVVVVQTPATPGVSSNSPICTGNNLSLLTPAVTGATYNWTGPNGFSSTVQNPVRSNVTLADAGIYSLVLTVNGCTSSAGTTTVAINPTPPAPAASSNSPVCGGATLKLYASSIPSATYDWTGPNGFRYNVQNPVEPSATLSYAGNYTVTATVNGCTSPTGTTTVIVYPTPETPIVTTNAPVCQGALLTLSSSNVFGASYTWTGPNGFTSVTQNPTISNVPLTAAGIYSVYATENGCKSSTASVNVVINPTPATPAASSNTPVCVGTPINLSTPVVPGATYSWTGTNGYTSSAQNPVINNATIARSGTYTVRISVNGCISAPGTTQVTVNPIPAAPVASSNSPLCGGGTLTLSATTVAGATYSWTGPNGYTANTQNPVINNVAVANSGAYSVTATVNGCTSAPAAANVFINPIPATPLATSNSPVCAGATITLSTQSVSNATYNWTGPNGFSSTQRTPTITNASAATAGTYSVTVTVSGCTSAACTTNLIVNPTPAAPVATANSPVCVGQMINLNTAPLTGAYYNWTGPAGFTANTASAVISNAIAASAGNYLVTATVNGCTGPAGTVSVVINPTPPPPSVNNNSPVCTGKPVNLTASAVTGASFNWTGPAGFTSTLQNPVINSATPANAGTYSAKVTLGGCTGSSASTVVVINQTPATPVATANSPVCSSNSINLSTATVTGGVYSWTGLNGYTTASQNPIINNASSVNAGIYSVTVTVNGCTSSPGSVNVVVNATPAAPMVNSNSPVCSGAAINLSAVSISGGSYSWTGPNGYSTNVQNPVINAADSSKAGRYSVTATVNGCTSPAGSVNVIVNPTPAAPVASNNSPVCIGRTINLTATAGVNGSFNWTGPGGFASTTPNPTIASATNANAGTYSVTITANGCVSPAARTTVAISPTPNAPTVSNNTPVCAGDTVRLTAAAVSNGIYNWSGTNNFSSAAQNPNIPNASTVESGSYRVNVTVAGCTSADAATTVVVNPIPTTPIVTSNSPLCAGQNLNLTASYLANAVYKWTGPNGFTSANQNPVISAANVTNSGNYWVTATVNNCTSAPAAINVSVNPIPQQPVAFSNSPVCTGGTISLSASDITGAVYRWIGPNGFASNNQFPVINNATTASLGYYKVAATVEGCTSAPDSVYVDIVPSPTVDAGPDKTIYEGDSTMLTPIVTGTGIRYQWTPVLYFVSADTIKNPIVSPITETVYTLNAMNSAGCKAKPDEVIVKVVPRLKPINVPNVFSPNGDGINDVWVIRELAKYPDAKVDVFTRYGNNVFTSFGYRKPWDGMWNGKPIPTGVYYYVITPTNSSKPLSGCVTILR